MIHKGTTLVISKYFEKQWFNFTINVFPSNKYLFIISAYFFRCYNNLIRSQFIVWYLIESFWKVACGHIKIIVIANAFQNITSVSSELEDVYLFFSDVPWSVLCHLWLFVSRAVLINLTKMKHFITLQSIEVRLIGVQLSVLDVFPFPLYNDTLSDIR